MSIHSEQAQLYRSHRLFLCIHCKIKVKKACVIIDSGNLAILNHRLFNEATSYSFHPSFLPSSLPSPLPHFFLSFLPHPSLTPSIFSLSSSIVTSLLPLIYIVYLFPLYTAIKPATMYSTTISPFTHLFSLSFLPYTFPTNQAVFLSSIKLSSVRPSIHHSSFNTFA